MYVMKSVVSEKHILHDPKIVQILSQLITDCIYSIIKQKNLCNEQLSCKNGYVSHKQ